VNWRGRGFAKRLLKRRRKELITLPSHYYPSLDGLRGLSIILVMMVHLQLIEPALWFAFPGGTLGVDVFFALSGFLITSLLLRESDLTGRIDLKRFYYRRALRLLPALISVLLFTFLVASIVGSLAALGLTRVRLLSTFFYFTNWVRAYDGPDTWFLGHFWSLALEEQFYLLWPLALILAVRLKLKKQTIFSSLVFLISASVIWKIVLVTNGTVPRRIFFGSDTRGDGILIGCALAVALNGNLFPSVLNQKASRSLILIGLMLLGAFAAVGDDRNILVYCGGTTVVAFAATMIIAGFMLNSADAFSKAFSIKFPIWLGRRSYGLYLWHWPLYEVARLVPIRTLIVPCAIISSIVIAAISFRFIETPFLKLKERAGAPNDHKIEFDLPHGSSSYSYGRHRRGLDLSSCLSRESHVNSGQIAGGVDSGNVLSGSSNDSRPLANAGATDGNKRSLILSAGSPTIFSTSSPKTKANTT
jgi:peptidoglycan/LPS O-acetylase OafA/YrhL